MTLPFFTVIIPAYNSGNYIAKAIISLQQQHFTNYEVIILDSMSVDDTADIISDFAQKDNRIRLIREKDKGIYDAMNKGITLAKGQWLYFLGSDDAIYNENVFADIAKKITENSPDILYGNVILIPQYKKYAGAFSETRILADNISHQAIFYNKIVFDTIGTYNLKYIKHADWDLNIRCFANHSLRIVYTDIIIALFNTGGAGSGNDFIFLKEMLIPERLSRLNNNRHIINNLKRYDEYWRLLRNSKISKEELHALTLSKSIRVMHAFQSSIPSSLIHIGIISKLAMFVSYLIFRILSVFKPL